MDAVTELTYTESSAPVQMRPPAAFFISKTTVVIVLACFIVLGNSLTIVAVVKTKKLRRLPTNTYIISLAVADTTVGIFLLCYQAVSLLASSETAVRISVCWARAPFYATITVSTCTLLAIAVDRYTAIVHPLSYKRRATIRRAVTTSASIWLAQLIIVGGTTCYYGLVASFGRVMTGSIVDLLPSYLFIWLILPQAILPVIGNIIVYTVIFVNIRNRKRVSDSGSGNKMPDKRTTAVTKMMMIILAYLLFAWLPYFCIAPKMNYSQVPPLWLVYINQLAIILLYTNSAVNPIIYSWMNRDFREAYVNILRLARTTDRSAASDGTKPFTVSERINAEETRLQSLTA